MPNTKNELINDEKQEPISFREKLDTKLEAKFDSSIRGKIVRDMITRVTNDHLIGPKIKSGELRKKVGINEAPWKCPDFISVETIEMPNFTMEYLTNNAITERDDKVILQLHGGGYVGMLHNAYRTFAGLYSEVSKGMHVLTIDYRVAPEHPYPAALEDAFMAYCWLLGNGYHSDQIIVAGDSAGGGLAMALCHYLKDHNMMLPLGIIAMSPWTDLTASGPSYDENYDKDPLFGGTRDSLIYNKEYICENDPTNPYISPLFGDFRKFPPMLIQVGGIEMLLSDSVSVASKAKDQGVKVKLSVYDGMFHVFQMAGKILPESYNAWVEIGHFIHTIC